MFKIKEYKITLKVISGLYIGAGDSNVRIGGVDNEFIKHPVSKRPFIPGSSLKGKIRSLLEYDAGILKIDDKDGNVFTVKDYIDCKDENQQQAIRRVLMLFGAFGNDYSKEIGMTRLSFSDLELAEKYRDNPMDTLEIKAETAIDREEGSAKTGSLRFTERVVEGVEFKGTISMKVFDGDKETDLEETLFKGIKLLMLDTLGGSGSRGYGRIEIKFDDSDKQSNFEKYTFK